MGFYNFGQGGLYIGSIFQSFYFSGLVLIGSDIGVAHAGIGVYFPFPNLIAVINPASLVFSSLASFSSLERAQEVTFSVLSVLYNMLTGHREKISI